MSRAAVAFAALAALSPVSGARGEDARVVVATILATDADAKVQDKVREIAAEVRKKYPYLTGYRLEQSFAEDVPLGQSREFKLDGDVRLTLKADRAGERMRLTVQPPTLGEITYVCAPNKYVPFVTHHRTAKGEQLIVAVMARPALAK